MVTWHESNREVIHLLYKNGNQLQRHNLANSKVTDALSVGAYLNCSKTKGFSWATCDTWSLLHGLCSELPFATDWPRGKNCGTIK